MGYIENNLNPGESVTYRTGLHAIVLAEPWLIPLLAILICAFMFRAQGEANFIFTGIILGGTLGVPIAIPLFLISTLRYVTTEYAITNRRVISKAGFIRRDTTETVLSKIEGINLSQGILGRLLNYGTVSVTGTGSRRNDFKRVRQPVEFRRALQMQVETGGSVGTTVNVA